MDDNGKAQRARPWPVARSPLSRSWSWVFVCAVVAVGMALLLHNARRYFPFFADDAFISLRYSERLLTGHGLTWTDGEPVEGYSNLLWVLGCALLGLLRIDLVWAARILGCVATAGTLAALAFHFVRVRTWPASALAALGATLALAVSGSIIVWSIGGLEQPLSACLVSWAMVLAFPLLERGEPAPGEGRRRILVGVLLGLACWTRPDGALWTGAVGLGLVLAHGWSTRGVRHAVAIGLLAAGFVAAQLVFRLAYYHEWVPNTALAKLAWTPQRLASGSAYLRDAARTYWPLGALCATALPALMFDRAARRRLALLLAGFVLWAGYVWAIGGDIFPAHRHALPLIVLAAFIAGEGVAWLGARDLAVGGVMALVACAVTVGRLDALTRAAPANRNAVYERWEWDAVPVSRMLRRHFGPTRALLAVDAAGALPYFAKLPAVDMLGMNDKYLTHHRPPDFGRRLIGHDLGDGRYVYERAPDLVVFHLPLGKEQPSFRGGHELMAQPGFHDNYELVLFRLPEGPLARIWIRRASPRLSPPGPAGQIHVPGFLLGNHGRLPVVESDGRLVVAAETRVPARASRVQLDAGAWTARPDSTDSEARITVSVPGMPLQQGVGALTFSVPEAGRVEIEIARSQPGRPLIVRGLVIERARP